MGSYLSSKLIMIERKLNPPAIVQQNSAFVPLEVDYKKYVEKNKNNKINKINKID